MALKCTTSTRISGVSSSFAVEQEGILANAGRPHLINSEGDELRLFAKILEGRRKAMPDRE
jgi:hypothetical protein